MPFRQATGRERCNDCHVVVALGAPLYVGELTPMHWCAPCAEANLGRTPDGPVPVKLPIGGMGAVDPKAMGAILRGNILKWRHDNRQKQTGERES